jgi:hypothetical protein
MQWLGWPTAVSDDSRFFSSLLSEGYFHFASTLLLVSSSWPASVVLFTWFLTIKTATTDHHSGNTHSLLRSSVLLLFFCFHLCDTFKFLRILVLAFFSLLFLPMLAWGASCFLIRIFQNLFFTNTALEGARASLSRSLDPLCQERQIISVKSCRFSLSRAADSLLQESYSCTWE